MRIAFLVAFAVACGPPAQSTGPTAPTPVQPPADLTRPAQPKPVAASDDPRLPQLYRCWFERPYRYMFTNDDASTGTFTAGTKGIVYYGNLADCMGDIADGGDYRVVGDHRPIELFTQLSVLVSDGGKFRSFNPELIRWGHENLIPPPETMIGDLTARDRYHAQFARFFRLMTEAYLTLNSSMQWSDEEDKYKGAVTGGTDGLDYLEKRFAGQLSTYAIAADGTAMTVPMAFGFWLRRGVDNTEGELWIGLRKVLRLYDPEWLAQVKKRYASASVEF